VKRFFLLIAAFALANLNLMYPVQEMETLNSRHSVSHIIVEFAVPVLHCAWNSTVEEKETDWRSEQKQGQLSYRRKQR
jgi:hypothetical protein